MSLIAMCGPFWRLLTSRTVSISPRCSWVGLCQKEGVESGGWECINVFFLNPELKLNKTTSHSQVCSGTDTYSFQYNAGKPVSFTFISFVAPFFFFKRVNQSGWRQESSVDGALAIRVSLLLLDHILTILACLSRLVETFCWLWRLTATLFVVCCYREETQPKSVAPEAPKETTVRPRKRKADVAIVSSLKGLQISLQVAFRCFSPARPNWRTRLWTVLQPSFACSIEVLLINAVYILTNSLLSSGNNQTWITHIITQSPPPFFDPQHLQDLDDEEVAEMTKKKQRDCEVGLAHSRDPVPIKV